MSLTRIKHLIRLGRYSYSEKVRAFIEDAWYSTEDLENCILTAEKIYKSELDDLGTAVDGKKYTIYGYDSNGNSFYTCGKVIKDLRGRLYFFITAHEP